MLKISIFPVFFSDFPHQNPHFQAIFALKIPNFFQIPIITLNGIEDAFTAERIAESIDKLRSVAEENLGMVMVFAIVSALQDEIGELVDVKKRAKEEKVEIEKEKKEAESRKKFEGKKWLKICKNRRKMDKN